MERITLGTAGLGGAWRPINFNHSVDAILFAFEQGITHIDMAPAYMDAELVVGEAIKQNHFKNVFLSTKIGKRKGTAEASNLNDYGIDSITKSFYTSLKRLHRDTIDLLFIHEPSEIPIEKIPEVVALICQFKTQGHAKQIGFGGKPTSHFNSYIEARLFDVVMDFNGYNLVENKALITDFKYYRNNALKIYEGSPLMMGLLGHRLATYTKEKPTWLSESHISKANALQQLALEHAMDLPTMAHRFLAYSNNIDQMVIGPAEQSQLETTIKAIKQGPLNTELLEQINNINSK